jgi:hypothetical protein
VNFFDLINNSVDAAIDALGDAVMDITIASSVPVDQQPGQDYKPSYEFYSGKGAFEKFTTEDYPATQVLVGDKSLVLLRCAADVKNHDYAKIGDTTYHVFDVKSDLVGQRRVLQKLLLREEPKEIEWESGGPVVSSIS